MGMLSSSMEKGGKVERLIGERELVRWVVEVEVVGGVELFVVDWDWDWNGLMTVSEEVSRLSLWL